MEGDRQLGERLLIILRGHGRLAEAFELQVPTESNRPDNPAGVAFSSAVLNTLLDKIFVYKWTIG